MKLIAFTGIMGSGKSTAISLLSKTHRVVNVKFAGPLYDIQEYIYKTISPVYTKEPDFIKDRRLLQWLGTEWGRETTDKNLWVNLWKERTLEAAYFNSGENTIITCDDVRFDNEAEKVKELGGIIIQLVASDTSLRNVVTNGLSGHKSESGVSSSLIDATIVNDGTIEDLSNKLYATLEKLDIL